MPLRLVVATDGAPVSGNAVRWSAESARTTGAEVTLVYVVSTVIESVLSAVQIDFVKVEAEHRSSWSRRGASPSGLWGFPCAR
jgi:nucleotide-binding universal stress UspA family protein